MGDDKKVSIKSARDSGLQINQADIYLQEVFNRGHNCVRDCSTSGAAADISSLYMCQSIYDVHLSTTDSPPKCGLEFGDFAAFAMAVKLRACAPERGRRSYASNLSRVYRAA